MADFPALPLWTDAYIADTTHLTNEEHGVYLRLLMFAWRSPGCSLPDDDHRIAIMVGVTPKKWATLKPTIMAFWRLEQGFWVQKKLTAQRVFVEGKSKSGRAGANGRWNAKSLENINTSDADASKQHMPECMPNGCETDGTHTHTQNHTQGIEVLRPSIPKKEEEARERDLVLEVMKAVGVDVDHPSTYWRGPAVEEHVALWADLGLTDIEIVETAKSSRQVHPDAPDGPRALDRFMEAAASAKRGVATTRKRAEKAPSPTPPTEDQAKAHAQSTAAWIKRGTCPASMLRLDQARAMLKDGLVTEDDLRKCGIAW